MNASLLEFRPHLDSAILTDHSWWDPDSECTVVISSPSTNPELWAEYLANAQASYQKYGVAAALDVEAVRDGSDTVMFWALLDRSDRMIGGVRAKGPLASADDSHAVIEWSDHPGLPAVRKMIDDRAPFGVLEMKSAWVTDDRDQARPMTRVLARSGFHAMTILDLRFCMATSAPHVLERWRSSGGVVAPIPAAAYPDERYRTKMMWWDRLDFAKYAEPKQFSKILQETAALTSLSMAG